MNVDQTLFTSEDEESHSPTADRSYSESVYFNFVDDDGELAGFMRIGNRLNAGHAEVTVLLYLADGAAAFRYAKPQIDAPSFDLAGLAMEVIEPLEKVRLTYAGDVYVMADGTALKDPRRAFASSPMRPLAFDLTFRGAMPVLGWRFGQGGATIDPGGFFAPNHYEAACHVSGPLTLDGRERAVHGQGLRDHSWGPRHWVGPDHYRWISCFTPSGEGFVAWISRMDEQPHAWGFLRRNGETLAIDDVAVHSEYDGPELYPCATTVSFIAGGERFTSRGVRVNLVPLRHRHGDEMARLSEVVFRWQFDGTEGHGIAEFHDRMVDGVPSGMGHA